MSGNSFQTSGLKALIPKYDDLNSDLENMLIQCDENIYLTRKECYEILGYITKLRWEIRDLKLKVIRDEMKKEQRQTK
jgi:hypothetical protein